MLFVALQHDELRMALLLERLQVGMNLERAEVTPERLVLVAGNFLIAKEQHLMLDERFTHLASAPSPSSPR